MKNALRRLQVKSQLPPHSHPAALLAALAVGTTVSWAADINCFLRNEKMNVADLETEMRKLVALFRGPGDRDAETCGAFLLRTTSSHFLGIHITRKWDDVVLNRSEEHTSELQSP